MHGFEDHPLIPEPSEEHDKLVGSRIDLQNCTGDLEITNRLRRQPGGEELVQKLSRVRLDDSGKVRIVAQPGDTGYSPESSQRSLSDAELEELIDIASTALEHAELNIQY